MPGGFDTARCSFKRLLRKKGSRWVTRGKTLRATMSEKAVTSPLNRVNRAFPAPCPNRLWVSDFTHVSARQGFVYVALIIEVFARCIVGWPVCRTTHTAASRPPRLPRSIGSTKAGSRSPSEISHPRRPRRDTRPYRTSCSWHHNLNQITSGKTRVVHSTLGNLSSLDSKKQVQSA